MAKCEICNKIYKDNRRMKRHLRETHNPKSTYKYCNKPVIRLKDHLKKCKRYMRYNLNIKNYKKRRSILIINTKQISKNKIGDFDYKLGDDTILDKAVSISETNFVYFKEFNLGNGTYGEVFYGINLKSKQEVAIKLYSDRSKENRINFESCLCKDFESLNIFPKIYYFSGINKVCVQSLLGPNLENIFNFCERKFDVTTISNIGIELINSIEQLHKLGFIHRDIKPKNIAWLNFSDYQTIVKNNLILIDFGLAGPYVTKENKHLAFDKKYGRIGTQYFASVNANKGYSLSRRDDLESIFYCLVYFFKGILPWDSKEQSKKNKDKLYKNSDGDDNNKEIFNQKINFKSDAERVLKIKEIISPSVICKGLPNEYKFIYCYIKNLSFSEKPDYNIIRLLLANTFLYKNSSKTKKKFKKFIWGKKIKDMLDSKKNIDENLKIIKETLFKGYPIKSEKLFDLFS